MELTGRLNKHHSMDDTRHDWTPNFKFYVVRFTLDSSSSSNQRFFGNLFVQAFVLPTCAAFSWRGLPRGSWQDKVELVALSGEVGDERPCAILLESGRCVASVQIHRFCYDKLFGPSSPRPPTPC